jgi:hypothetical protein
MEGYPSKRRKQLSKRESREVDSFARDIFDGKRNYHGFLKAFT